MCDSPHVQVLDAGQQLLKVPLRLLLCHPDVWLCRPEEKNGRAKTISEPVPLSPTQPTNRSLHLPILSKSSPPAAYSRNMYSMSPWLRCPKNLRMCGWLRAFWMQTSFFTEVPASGCFFRSTIFMATASPDWRLMSSFTLYDGPIATEGKDKEEKRRERGN